MTLVVADTTPLRYLVEIDYEHLLPRNGEFSQDSEPVRPNAGTGSQFEKQR
jgi:hypothetical protein